MSYHRPQSRSYTCLNQPTTDKATMNNTFVSDYGSEIQLADVPYPCLEAKAGHRLWEGANTRLWIETILTQHELTWKYKKTFQAPEGRWYYHVFEIDGIEHTCSIAKKNGNVWVVSEHI